MKEQTLTGVGFEIELLAHLIRSDLEDSTTIATMAMRAAFNELYCGRSSGIQAEGGVGEFGQNGYRVYTDHARPEICSPLFFSASDLILSLRETLGILGRCLAHAETEVGPIRISFANSSRQGACWGHHLNVLTSRSAFDRLRDEEWRSLYPQWIPFLVMSLPLFGVGKVGAENDASDCDFQISSRADWFDAEIGSETVFSKSLWNTRDEPLADETRFARAHVTFAEFSFWEYSMYLRFGTAQLLFALIAEEYALPDVALANPLEALGRVSRDLSLKQTQSLEDGRKVTSLDLMEILSEAVAAAVERGSPASSIPDAKRICELWIEAVNDLRKGAPGLERRIPWVAKKRFIDTMDDPIEAMALDLKSADLSAVLRLYERGLVERLEDFLPASSPSKPPSPYPRDRARAEILKKFGESVVEVDWDVVVLRDSAQTLWSLDLGDILHAEEALKASAKASGPNELIHRLVHRDLASPASEMLLVICPIREEEDSSNDGFSVPPSRGTPRDGSEPRPTVP